MEYSSLQFNYLSSLFRNSTGGINSLDIEDKCLQCNQIITPEVVNLYTFNPENSSNLDIGVLLFCQKCKHFFVREYNISNYGGYLQTVKEITKPNDLQCDIYVSENINEVSPRFKEIYSQSAKAESCNLYEICGPGYRKALEFLIRDFAKYIHPEKKESIDNTAQIGQVINNFYNENAFPELNPIIYTLKPLIKIATYVGNDETHYIRKWRDKDINDLKQYIESAKSIIDAYIESVKSDELINQDNNN